jgi:signal transduction histidine kinase
MSISNPSQYILELRNLSVSDVIHPQLNNVNLKVKRGEIHAILGDKDSGKTTLVHVLSGMIPKFSGEIVFDKHVVHSNNPANAMALGIETIHRNIKISPSSSLYENLFIGRWPKKNFLWIDRKLMKEKAYQVLQLFLSDQNIDIRAPLKNFNSNLQNIVDIASSFCVPSKLLIVDEISGRLDPHQVEKLQYLLSLQRQRGTAILYICSNIDEIYKFANYVSIMKSGKIIETFNISSYDKVQLAQLAYSHMYNRKELERRNFELYYLKNFNESIINNIPMSLLVTDTRGHIIFVNKRFSQMFEVESEQFLNHNFNDLLRLSNEHLVIVNQAIISADVKRIYPLETSLGKTSGKIVMDLLPFYDQDNAFLGTIFLFNDLFESLNLETRIINFKKMGLFKNSVMGLAHEMRNPLAIILNFLKIIKSEDSFDRIKENADRIEKEVSRLKDVISDLLSRFHAEKDELLDLIHVEKFFNGLKNLLIPTMKDKNIDLKLNLRENLVLHIEPELFKQLVMNLIINSIEAMPSGGYIEINDSYQDVDNRRYYVFNFKDTGIGIKEEDIPYIFDAFFTSKQSDEIRGLGLSICNDIITKYRGFITVTSCLNQGTTFHIFIPEDLIVNKSRT